MKSFKQSLIAIFVGLLVVAGISFAAPWVGPTASPPDGNADAPINVGPLAQIKTGGWLSLGNLISRGATLLARDGGNVGIGLGITSAGDPVLPNAKLDVAGNINFTGQKICSVLVSGNWRDTIFIPSSWTSATCKSYMEITGTMAYQLGCIFENSFSFGAADGGIPSPNCGWTAGPGILQAEWRNGSPGLGWINTGLSDCDLSGWHDVSEDSCTDGGGPGNLYLHQIN